MTETNPGDDEVDLGLDWYASKTAGIGGELKRRPQDFRVTEIEEFSYSADDEDEGRKHAVVRVKLTNYETHEFARDLSNALGISRKRVSWAGTKDRRAVTTQLMTVAGVDEERLAGVDLHDAEIEYVGRSHHNIHLGALRGNKFDVKVRDAEHPENAESITREIDEFGGVPNLFGSQRFGSHRPITHKVGERILEDDYEGAVMEYLTATFDEEPEDTREARRRLADERDYNDALDYFPERLGYERALLNELVQTNDYSEALDALPENLRRLFVNAVQSRIFNIILRRRHDAGLRFDEAYEGDVVCFTDGRIDGVPLPDTDSLQRVTESNVDTVNRHVERGRAFVTAPLVGYNTQLSDGEQGEIERAVLDTHGIEPGDFERDDEYSSAGTRRAVLVHPDVEYETDGDTARFEFVLPKGSYATVVLREYLKDGADG